MELLATIPLAFTPNQRGPIITSSSPPTKDARMVRCFNSVFGSNITGTKEAYLEKIPGWPVSFTPAAGSNGTAIFVTPSATILSAFGSTTSTIYSSTTNIGSTETATVARRFTWGSLDGVETVFFLADDGWYLPSDATSVTAYTADGNNSTTITDIKISGVNNTAGIYPGQLLTASTNIVAGTRVVSVNAGAFTAVLDTATTGGAFNDLAITKTPIAKITDSDYTSLTHLGNFEELNGYVFAAVQDGFTAGILNSDLNSASAWDAASFIPCQISDIPATVAKYQGMIVYFGSKSVQFFSIANNQSGSILSQSNNLTIDGIGCVGRTGAAPALCSLGGTIYWLGRIEAISGIYRLNGFSAEPIQSVAASRQLSAVIAAGAGTADYAFDGFSMFGLDFLYIGAGDIGYLYCVQNNEWSEAGFFSGGMRVAGGFSTANNPILYGVRKTGTTGKVYVMDKTNLTYQDDGADYSMICQTPVVVANDGLPFFADELEVLADTQSSGTITCSVSGDDGITFTDIGTFDKTANRKVIPAGGYFQNSIQIRLTDSHNSANRMQAIKVWGRKCKA